MFRFGQTTTVDRSHQMMLAGREHRLQCGLTIGQVIDQGRMPKELVGLVGRPVTVTGLFDQMGFADVVVNGGGETYRVHRDVLLSLQ